MTVHEQRPGARSRLHLLLWIVPALVTIWVYSPVLRIWFIGDDLYFIIQEGRDGAWSELFKPRPGWVHYSPGSLAYWKLVHGLVGMDSVGWHLSSLTLQVLASLLHFAALRRLGLPLPAAFAASVLFATLFLGYEAVVSANMAMNLFALIWYLVAVCLYRRYQAQAGLGPYLAFLAAAYVAILVYENALMVLLVLPLLETHAAGWRAAVSRWRRYCPVAAVVALGFLPGFLASRAGHPDLPPVVQAVKKFVIGLSYMASFNQPDLLAVYFSHRPLRIVATLAICAGALWCVRRGGWTRLLCLWALIHQLPYLLMTGHHPRYFLFSALGYTGLWGLGLWEAARVIGRGRGVRAVSAALAILLAVCSWRGVVYIRGQIDRWHRASAAVRALADALVAEAPRCRHVLLANFPHLYGPLHDVYWPPYFFRAAFNRDALPRLLWPTSANRPEITLVSTRPGDGTIVAEQEVSTENLLRAAAAPDSCALVYDKDTERPVVLTAKRP